MDNLWHIGQVSLEPMSERPRLTLVFPYPRINVN
jgi:hypothetical protein